MIKSGLSERIKEIRTAMGYTQKQMASALELKLPSLQDYEQSKSIPGGNVISSLVNIGINGNWLLNGIGEMLLHIDLSLIQQEIVKQFRSYHGGDITCQQLAIARESFIHLYLERNDMFEEDITWLFEEEPEISLQELILWDNSYREDEYIFEIKAGSIRDNNSLREATEEIEKVLEKYHTHLPLWLVGRVQELVVNEQLTIAGIKPLIAMFNQLLNIDVSSKP